MTTFNMEFRQKPIELRNTILNMFHLIYRHRPTCAEMLSEYSQWGIECNQVQNSVCYHGQLNQIKNQTNKFFYKYLIEKFNLVKP